MRAQIAIGINCVAFEFDVGDAIARPFFDLEGQGHGSLGNFFDLWIDLSFGPAFIGQQLFDDRCGATHFHRIVLRFFRQADRAFAELFEHRRLLHRLQAFILDLEQQRPFAHFKGDDLAAARAFFGIDLDIVEVALRVQGAHVAVELLRIVWIALARADPDFDGGFGNTAVTANVHLFDRHVLIDRCRRLKHREIALAGPDANCRYQYCKQAKNTLSHK